MKHFLLLGLLILTFSASAQIVIGRMVDQARGQTFLLYDNGYFVEEGNTMNTGFVTRDPSGIMYLMISAVDPYNTAYFLDWNNQIIEVDRYRGSNVIGFCNCPPPPTNPYMNIYQQPVISNNFGVETPSGFQPLPDEIVDINKPYGKPMLTSEIKAQECYQQAWTASGGLDRDKFSLCMLENMAGERELEIFNCIRNSKTPVEQTICLFGILGGNKEQQISEKLAECYSEYGSDFSKYPLCMSGLAVDGDLATVIACMEQQSRSSGQVSLLNTAICYGADNLDLNTETQIILKCAIASGGEPNSFVGCAGGQLMARELDKCFEFGVGGDKGCFGDNNEIVKGLKSIGEALSIEFGRNNTIVDMWNTAVYDFTLGPGPNNTAINTLKNIGDEVGRTSDKIARAFESAIPKITF